MSISNSGNSRKSPSGVHALQETSECRCGCQCNIEVVVPESLQRFANDYGIRDGILAAACEFLPESEIRKLIDRYCNLVADEEKKGKPSGDEKWNRPGCHYWNSAVELARGIKDGPLHEMALKSWWSGHALNSAAWNDIAKVIS